jgi:hypothetical protein
MVVTDDVERFMKFAAKFWYLADHFLMTTSYAPTIQVKKGVLPIPPRWRFPATFPFLAVRRDNPESGRTEHQVQQDDNDDVPPRFHLEGPATMLPLYMMIEVKSDVKGEGHVSALAAPCLPQAAIDLMVRRPVKELIQRRTVWFPTDRFASKDPFLTDLRIGHERGVFPVYFGRFPTSEAVAVCGGVQIAIPSKVLSADCPSMAAKWSRALLRLTKLPKDEAQAALLDLSEVFADTGDQGINATQIEIRLFEFSDIDQRLFYPALLVRE